VTGEQDMDSRLETASVMALAMVSAMVSAWVLLLQLLSRAA